MQEYIYKIRFKNEKLGIDEEFEFFSENASMTKTEILDWDSITILSKKYNPKKSNNLNDEDVLDNLKDLFGFR